MPFNLTEIDIQNGDGSVRVPERQKDPGSQSNETADGLDAETEVLRHSIEDSPSGASPEDIEKTPVFAEAMRPRQYERVKQAPCLDIGSSTIVVTNGKEANMSHRYQSWPGPAGPGCVPLMTSRSATIVRHYLSAAPK
jgi:hypothetical protein